MDVALLGDSKALVPAAVQANKEHQYALKVYTDRLETELKHLDKLLVSGCRHFRMTRDLTVAASRPLLKSQRMRRTRSRLRTAVA